MQWHYPRPHGTHSRCHRTEAKRVDCISVLLNIVLLPRRTAIHLSVATIDPTFSLFIGIRKATGSRLIRVICRRVGQANREPSVSVSSPKCNHYRHKKPEQRASREMVPFSHTTRLSATDGICKWWVGQFGANLQ